MSHKKIDKNLVEGIFELSDTQMGILFHYLEETHSNLYNIQLLFKIEGEMDIEMLKQAIHITQSQNEVLRSVFRWEEVKQPLQIVLKECTYSFKFYDLATFEESERERRVQKIVKEDNEERFDISHLPLRFRLIKTRPHVFLFLISYNHILLDGWSNSILIKEIIHYYKQLKKDTRISLIPKSPYLDIQRSRKSYYLNEEANHFWSHYLANYHIVSLFERENTAASPIASTKKIHRSIPISQLEQFAQKHNITKASVIYAAYGILLQRYAFTSDVIFGTVVSNREARVKNVDKTMGNFINTLPIRFNIPQKSSLVEAVNIVNKDLLDRTDYHYTSYASVKKLIGLKPNEDLFDSILVIENYPIIQGYNKPNEDFKISFESFSENIDTPLMVSVFMNEKLNIEFLYNESLVNASFIESLSHHLFTIIDTILTSPEHLIESVDILTPPERELLLDKFNQTHTKGLEDKTVVELFEEQVQKFPDKPAVIDKDCALTFQELNGKCNQLARKLIETGIKRGDTVGLMVARRKELIIGMLGILKAGGHYLPIDPTFPSDRIQFMIENSGLHFLVTESSLTPLFTQLGTQIKIIDILSPSLNTYDKKNVQIDISPSDLIYLIYTSGSTGRPKGITIEHSNIVNYVEGVSDRLNINYYESILCLTTISFDIIATETFLPLLKSIKIVLADAKDQKDPEALNGLMLNHKVDLMQITPSHLSVLLKSESLEFLNTVKAILVGGEAFPTQLLQQLRSRFGGKIFNMYGPTETTVWSTIQDLTEKSSIDVGSPIRNTSLYILDGNQNLQPIDIPGELYIGGHGVARGYWKNDALNQEKFIDSPFNPGEKLFKTGDLAYWLPNGDVKLLGRLDTQVKVRGFRIELGEIESQLIHFEGIKDVAVAIRGENEDKYIAAYYVSDTQYEISELKEFLLRKLPEYMIPSYFVKLQGLPLTPNGKIDRKGLPAPNLSVGKDFRSPLNETEEKLRQIWSELLGHDQISTNVNFFDIGGDSIKLITASSKIKKEFNREVSISDLFAHPSISSLANFLTENVETSEQTGKRVPGPYPNSPNGERESGDIAIIGIAGRFPGAPNLEAFWTKLKNGEELISRETTPINSSLIKAKGFLEGYEYFDSNFFNYTPSEAQMMDPQIRVFHECVYEGLENAGYNPYAYEGRIGLFGGATPNPFYNINISNLPSEDWIEQWDQLTYIDKDFLCPRISYKLNLKGPSLNISTACSTSLVAVEKACNELLANHCEIAVAGGVSITLYDNEGYYYRTDMIMSSDGRCRAFDEESTGTVGGNGAGVVVLKKLEHAIRDGDFIHAVIKGAATNNDGSDKVGFTAPSVNGQSKVIKMALDRAGLESAHITYVEAHGSGTPLGDPIEIAALTKAFNNEKKQYCAVGSVKTNIGHLDAAAGIAGLLKTILALKHKQIPPSLHFQNPNPNIDFENSPFYISKELTDWKRNGLPRRAGVSSFGIGGTNAHVILEEAPELYEQPPTRNFQILTFSAKSQTALEENIQRVMGYLKASEATEFADIAYTLNVGKPDFSHRKVIVSTNKEEAISLLQQAGRRKPKQLKDGRRQVVFMFPGLGSQYVNMFKDLYEHESLFKSTVDACLHMFTEISGIDLKRILFPEGSAESDSEALHKIKYAHPSLFILEYALVKLLNSWGIEANVMIGHSIGEYVAACIGGVFSLEDALKLVTKRSQLIQDSPRGSMLGISITEKELRPLLEDHSNLSIAALNSSELCVVSGSEEAIKSFQKVLTEKGYAHQAVKTSHASHSHMMDSILEEYEKTFEQVKINPPRKKFISNLTGELATYEEISDPRYWVRHLRETVRFSHGISNLLTSSNSIFIEIGPGNVLATFVRSNDQMTRSQRVINTGKHEHKRGNDLKFLLEALGKLWGNGVAPDWAAFYSSEKRKKVSLPTYAFEKIRYPVTPINPDRALGGIQASSKEFGDWFHAPSWEITEPIKTAFGSTKKCNLYFSSNEEVDQELIKKFTDRGEKVIQIKKADLFFERSNSDFGVNPVEEADFLKLFTRIAREESIRLIFTWGLSKNQGADHSFEQINEDLETYFYSLLNIAKALTEHFKTKVEIVSITNQACHVLTGDEILPEKSTLLGALKVIEKEYNNIDCRNIDIILPEKIAGTLIDLLYKECTALPTERSIAYRFDTRFTESFRQVITPKETKKQIPFRAGQVYVITGGIGGIGISFVQRITRDVKGVHFVLLSRKTLPEKAHWKEWLLANEDSGSVIYPIVKELNGLQERGAIIHYYRVDIVNEVELKGVITEVEQKVGVIKGVIHAAGIADYAGIIINRAKEENEKVFSAKIYGTIILNKLLERNALDFFVLCSSISAALPVEGQVGYVAANMFLNAFSRYNTNKGIPTISIAWNAWREVGMATKALRGSKVDNISEANSISPEEGYNILVSALTYNLPELIISKYDIAALLQRLEAGNELIIGENLPKDIESNGDAFTEVASIEEKMLALWKRLLGLDHVAPEDDFFEIGGNSLKALTMIGRMHKAFHVEIKIKEFFNHSTLRSLSEYVYSIKEGDAYKKGNLTIPSAEQKEVYPLSSAQKRLYFLYEFDKCSLAYNVFSVKRLEGEVDKAKLERAFKSLIAHHDSLRTSFEVIDFEVVQRVWENVDFEVEHYTSSKDEVSEVIGAFIRPFDLGEAPLFRVALIEVDDHLNLLVIDMHHIISDGISEGLLMKGFMAFYNGDPLEISRLQYKDYAEWQQRTEQQVAVERQKEFWLNEFSEPVNALQLPTDFPRPSIISFEGNSIDFQLETADVQRLKAIAEQEGVTLFILLLSAFNILLSKLSNQEDVVIGTPVANRQHADFENIIGMFVNTLAIRNYPIGTLSIKDFIAEVKAKILACFDHQSYQYEDLIDQIYIERDTSRNALFDCIFVFQNTEQIDFAIPGLKISNYPYKNQVSKFDLALEAIEVKDQLYLKFVYATSLFEEGTIRRIVTYFKQIISHVLSDLGTHLSAIEILPDAEKNRLLVEFNDTGSPFPEGKTVLDLFETQVQRYSDHTALIFEGQTLTYQALNERSNQLANYLIEKGVTVNALVGICIERSIDMIVGMMGILKAGAAYVPIDPIYPMDRIHYIIRDADLEVIISSRESTGNLSLVEDVEEKLVLLDEHSDRISQCSLQKPPIRAEDQDLMYVIYTSGSTGRPKGVLVEHRSVVNLLQFQTKDFNFKSDERVLQFFSYCFDASVDQIFLPLVNGAALVLISKEDILDEDQLQKVIRENNVTDFRTTPTYLNNLKGMDLSKLRRVTTGGEPCPAVLVEELRKKVNYYNFYGPTEATVIATQYHYSHAEEPLEGNLPIGKPISNAYVYVLNSYRQLVPIGVPGELYIGGICLSRGYLNKGKLNGEKYIENPFDKNVSPCLYKTGDIVKWHADGTLEFLERADSQIKIRGFRVELGEIQKQLNRYSEIQDSYVSVKGQSDSKYLVAYYISEKEIPLADLRRHASEKLPDYMIPSYFVHLEKFPLTLNGKIDTRALPNYERSATKEYAKPVNQIQKDLVKIWAELLEISADKIGVHTSFFELGGNSLKLVRMVKNINQQFDVEIKVVKLFNFPTIASIAEFLREDLTYESEVEVEDGMDQLTNTLKIIESTNN